jgi:hypothetical protein
VPAPQRSAGVAANPREARELDRADFSVHEPAVEVRHASAGRSVNVSPCSGATARKRRSSKLRMRVDRRVVGTLQAPDGEAPAGEIDEKRPPGRGAEALPEEVVDLAVGRGNHERPGLARERVEDRHAPWLGRIGERDDRRGVDEQRHVPNPSSRSWSGISEMGRGSSSIRGKPAASAKSRSREGARSSRGRSLRGTTDLDPAVVADVPAPWCCERQGQ